MAEEFASIPTISSRDPNQRVLYSVASSHTRPTTEFPSFRIYGFFTSRESAQAHSDLVQEKTNHQFTTTQGPCGPFLLMWENEDSTPEACQEAILLRMQLHRTYLVNREARFASKMEESKTSKHAKLKEVQYQSDVPPLPPSELPLRPWETPSSDVWFQPTVSPPPHMGSTFYKDPAAEKQLTRNPEEVEDQKYALICIIPDQATGHYPQSPDAEKLNNADDPDRARLIWSQQSIGRQPLIAFLQGFRKSSEAKEVGQQISKRYPWYRFTVVNMYRWVTPAVLFRDYWKIPKIYMNPKQQEVMGMYQKRYLEHKEEIEEQELPGYLMEKTLDEVGNPLPGTELYHLDRGETEKAQEIHKAYMSRQQIRIYEEGGVGESKEEPMDEKIETVEKNNDNNPVRMAYVIRSLLHDFRSRWESSGKPMDFDSVQRIREDLCASNNVYREMAYQTHPRVFRRITQPHLQQSELDMIYSILKIRQQVVEGQITESYAHHLAQDVSKISVPTENDFTVKDRLEVEKIYMK